MQNRTNLVKGVKWTSVGTLGVAVCSLLRLSILTRFLDREDFGLVGLFSIILSIILLFWATLQLLLGNVIHGWFSMITVIIFFGGIQTFAIGIIGEYIGKIYIQSKGIG